MELITNIIIEYLKHNKRIVVPKLGAFIVKQPLGIIRFSELMRNDDGVLRSLLIAYGLKELEAIGAIDRFVFEIRHAVSAGENYTVEHLGEFRASDNNTINFVHKHEPIVVGGNVKPPVETLEAEKRKLQRANRLTPDSDRDKIVAKTSTKPKRKATKTEEDNLSLSKPDAYLRGLKYDKDKNKKRGEERSDNRRTTHRPRRIFILLFMLIVLGGMWAGWQWLDTQKSMDEVDAVVRIEETPIVDMHEDITTIEHSDSLVVDSTKEMGLNVDSITVTE